MATIQEQINQLKIDKQTLVDNLVAKGVEATNNETFTTLVPKINDIQGGIDINDYFETTYSGTSPNFWANYNFIKKCPDLIIDNNVTSISSLFYTYYNSVIPKIICNSNVTNMSSLYRDCIYANNIDVSGLNTSNVTNIREMFQNNQSLTSLDASNFDTSKVTDIRYIFHNDKKLTNLNLSSWNTSKVTNMIFAFYNCSSLKNLDIRNFDFSNVTSYENMFYNVPTDCLIIVKDDTAKTWITEKFTTLTNVKTVAELGE